MNITGTGGVRRSGRIFAHVPPIIENGGTFNHDKGKKFKPLNKGTIPHQSAV